MSATWFTADTHFRHARCAQWRGFASAEAHDAEVIRRWNQVVAPNDQVWHLGDVGMGSVAAVLHLVDQLHGTIHLLSGNHDVVWPGHRQAHRHQREWLEHFETVQPFARRRMNGHDVLLCHFPYRGDHTATERYPDYRLHDTGKPLIHGHVHDAWRIRDRQINVGLDRWDLRPVPIDTLVGLVNDVVASTAGPRVDTAVEKVAAR